MSTKTQMTVTDALNSDRIAKQYNDALLAAAILGGKYPHFREAVRRFRENQTRTVLAAGDPRSGLTK